MSLLALYGYGGWLVSRGLMPLRVLLSAIGFTFSLVFASQGVVQSFTDTRRVGAGLRRYMLSCSAKFPGACPAFALHQSEPVKSLMPHFVRME